MIKISWCKAVFPEYITSKVEYEFSFQQLLQLMKQSIRYPKSPFEAIIGIKIVLIKADDIKDLVRHQRSEYCFFILADAPLHFIFLTFCALRQRYSRSMEYLHSLSQNRSRCRRYQSSSSISSNTHERLIISLQSVGMGNPDGISGTKLPQKCSLYIHNLASIHLWIYMR